MEKENSRVAPPTGVGSVVFSPERRRRVAGDRIRGYVRTHPARPPSHAWCAHECWRLGGGGGDEGCCWWWRWWRTPPSYLCRRAAAAVYLNEFTDDTLHHRQFCSLHLIHRWPPHTFTSHRTGEQINRNLRKFLPAVFTRKLSSPSTRTFFLKHQMELKP